LQEQLQAAQRRVQSAEKTGQERNAQIAKLRGELARTQALQKSREEQRVQKLRGQVDVYKGELAVMRQSVRYRLGDAFVRACIPSWDTLQLPFRVVALLRDGLRQRRARRDAEQSQPRPALPVSTATARPREDSAPMVSAAPQPPPAAIAGADLDRIPTLAEPFSSPPPELRRRSDLVLAAVTDEFSWEAWRYEAECYTFTPTTWRAALEARRPDLLLVESAWSGVGNSWYFQVRDLGQRGDVIKYYALPEIVAWCRAQGVPTVFYNKEDPPHFDVFLEAARQFDYVFTSDANCIEAYRRHLGHERVFSLPFAAQPRIHNPIMTGTRSGAVCFAGTWYANRHFDRQSDAEIILRPALDFDLHIFDRRAASGDPNFRWPDEFLPALRGSLPYAQMLAAYKRYRVFLNLNSVADSPTMFARRVFELLACGTPVISASSPGIAALLGADTVLLSDSAAQTRAHLERVLGDDSFREQLALRGQRKVFGAHTYTHRLQTILDTIGLPRDPMAAPALTMVAAVADPAEAASAWANYDRQAYPHKRLVMCATRADAVAHVPSLAGADANVSVLVIEGAQWGQVLGAAMAEAPGYVCALHPAHHYGPHYLTDYAHATLYVTEPALGKATHYEAQNGTLRVVKSGQEYRVVSGVNPWTLCLTRAHAQACAVQLAHAQTPEEWWNRSMRSLERLYSADRFNYVRRTEQPTGGDDANAAHAPALEPAVV
jgi:spore maturation protein CgeB